MKTAIKDLSYLETLLHTHIGYLPLINVRGVISTVCDHIGSLPGNNNSQRSVLVALIRDLSSQRGTATHVLLPLAISSLVELSSGVPSHILVCQHEMALCHIMEYLNKPQNPMSITINWKDTHVLMALVNTTLERQLGAHLSSGIQQYVSVIVVQAFLATLNSKSCLKWVGITGPPHTSSEYFKGLALDLPRPVGAPLEDNSRGSLLLFTLSLDETALQLGNGVASTGTPHTPVNSTLCGYATEWADLGVRIVATQRIIAPVLRHALHSVGISTLEQLSIMHVDSVASMSGATPLGLLPARGKLAGMAHIFGYVDSMHTKLIGDKALAYIARESSNHASLILCAPDSLTLQWLEQSSRAALDGLLHLLQTPFIVAGAGCLEVHLAHVLRTKGAQYEEIAKALETAAASLDSSIPASDLITQLMKSNHPTLQNLALPRTVSYYGWDPRHHQPICVLKKTGDKVTVARMVDLLLEKQQALQLSISTINTISRMV